MSEDRQFAFTNVFWLEPLSWKVIKNLLYIIYRILIPLDFSKIIEIKCRIAEQKKCNLEKCRWTGFILVVWFGIIINDLIEVVKFKKDLAGSKVSHRMLAEMVRLSYQHRAFYCYVILSVWIFLLVAGNWRKFRQLFFLFFIYILIFLCIIYNFINYIFNFYWNWLLIIFFFIFYIILWNNIIV